MEQGAGKTVQLIKYYEWWGTVPTAQVPGRGDRILSVEVPPRVTFQQVLYFLSSLKCESTEGSKLYLPSSFGHIPQIVCKVIIYDLAIVRYYRFHLISSLPQELGNVDIFLSISGYNAYSLINDICSIAALKFM